MVFIKLLMVRGILSASFPVIAVIVSPSFRKDSARVSEPHGKKVFLKTGVAQA